MRITSTNALCPSCGTTATISIVERRDPLAAGEGHSVEFECGGSCPAPDEVTLLRLWAAARSSTGSRAHVA